MGLRERLRRLEQAAEDEAIVIPQRDGPPARFPREAAREAFVNLMGRLGAGGDAPPEHPMLGAIRNAAGTEWEGTVYDAGDPDRWTAEIPDLSG